MSTLTTQILLALVDSERYGYEILKEIERHTDGSPPRTASLYAALHRLKEDDLIREAPDAARPEEDERRTYYAITPIGLATVRDETLRMARIVELARKKKLVPYRLGKPGAAMP